MRFYLSPPGAADICKPPALRLERNTSNPSFRTSSPGVNEIRNPENTNEINSYWIPARARFAGLGRDDELRHRFSAGGRADYKTGN